MLGFLARLLGRSHKGRTATLCLSVLVILLTAYVVSSPQSGRSALGASPVSPGSNSVASTTASSSPNWVMLSPSKSPSARASQMMAYDTKDGYVLLFGGYCNTPPPDYSDCNDTWEFSHGQWKELFPAHAPSPRESGVMAYDPRDGYVVLFGGLNTQTYAEPLSDTWKFVGGQWTQLAPASSPPARYLSQMAFDSKDNYLLLFGGSNTAVELRDTWAYYAGDWHQLHPTASPAARDDAALKPDSKDKYLVLFGGENGPGSNFADTWKFVSGQWTLLSPSVHPPALDGPGMAYDTKRSYDVLFGGFTSSGAYADTWEFVGGKWTQLHPTSSPPARGYVDLVYDPTDGYLLLFGGQTYAGTNLGDSWAFE